VGARAGALPELIKPEVTLEQIEKDYETKRRLLQKSEDRLAMLRASLSGQACPACGAKLLVTAQSLEILDKQKTEILVATEKKTMSYLQQEVNFLHVKGEEFLSFLDSQDRKKDLLIVEQKIAGVEHEIRRLKVEIAEGKRLEPMFAQRSVTALKVLELERAEREFREQERSLLNRKAELEAKVNQIPALEKEITELEVKIALGENHKEDFERLEGLKVSIARAEMQNKLAEQYRNWETKLAAAKKRYELLDRCKSEANYILATQIRLCKAEFENRMNQALSEMELEHQVKIDLEETADGEIKGVGVEVWSRGDWRNFHSGINKASQTVLKTVAALVQRNLFESRLKVPFVIVDDPGFGCQNDVLENLYSGLKTLTKGRTIVLTAWKGAEALLRPEKVYQLQMINNETRLA
jgi:hypothetical protein